MSKWHCRTLIMITSCLKSLLSSSREIENMDGGARTSGPCSSWILNLTGRAEFTCLPSIYHLSREYWVTWFNFLLLYSSHLWVGSRHGIDIWAAYRRAPVWKQPCRYFLVTLKLCNVAELFVSSCPSLDGLLRRDLSAHNSFKAVEICSMRWKKALEVQTYVLTSRTHLLDGYRLKNLSRNELRWNRWPLWLTSLAMKHVRFGLVNWPLMQNKCTKSLVTSSAWRSTSEDGGSSKQLKRIGNRDPHSSCECASVDIVYN